MKYEMYCMFLLHVFVLCSQDYAGCGAVHVVGGTASLIGAKLVGPRLGRFDEKGRSHLIEGHTLPVGIIALFSHWYTKAIISLHS